MMIFDDPRQLVPLVKRYPQMRAELADVHQKLDQARRSKYTFASFVGASRRCMSVKDQARRAARTTSPVLLLGETGTGKELLAHAIHAASPRAGGPFVAVNLAAIPETLLEAEFFGVAPGAYTGAERKGRAGKFELADGGTLFLDEIGDMSQALQAKLLRVLQEHEVEPVVSNRLLRVDVRVIAATSRDLQREVDEGRFRADLFYRINVFTLRVPSLRERYADLPLLAESLIDASARQLGESPRSISATALDRLGRYAWPGNVRELANVLERALRMSDSDTLSVSDVERALPPGGTKGDGVEQGLPRTLDQIKREAERQAILAALAACQGNKAQAARRLGISRASLYEKLAAQGIGSSSP